MHELSIAMEVCQMAEDRLGADALPRIVSIGLTIGDDSGIEPGNLEFCLEALLRHPPFRSARAVIDRCAGDALRLDYLEVDDERPADRGS